MRYPGVPTVPFPFFIDFVLQNKTTVPFDEISADDIVIVKDRSRVDTYNGYRDYWYEIIKPK